MVQRVVVPYGVIWCNKIELSEVERRGTVWLGTARCSGVQYNAIRLPRLLVPVFTHRACCTARSGIDNHWSCPPVSQFTGTAMGTTAPIPSHCTPSQGTGDVQVRPSSEQFKGTPELQHADNNLQ